jgi:hypothetical protein
MPIRLFAALVAVCFAPIAAFTADNEDVNPYKSAKVGDYVTYSLNIKLGTNTIMGSSTQTVTAKSEKEATIKVVASVGGMEVPPQTQTVDLTKPYDASKGLPPGIEGKVEKLKDGKENLKVGGKEYATTWTTYNVKAKVLGMDVNAQCKVWMSKDISLGMVKMEMTAEVASTKMETTMEATETGNKKP